jgi:hypothetical protein
MRVLVFLACLALSSPFALAQERPLCHDWTECRQFALKAYADHDYDSFHDFARRSLAAGPPRDAKLLLLLARAESLTGRVDDARRTLERLARMGVKVDIASNDDFRSLRAAGPAESAGSTEPVEPARPGVSAPDAPAMASETALRIPATRISPTGLAYDHVSGRFLMADSSSDKLVSVDELSRHMVDLVKADSAGFRDITAFEIDTRRGDLWVVSAGRPGGTDHDSVTALHKLQLISGRPLAKFQPGDGFGDTRFEDVAVTTSGDVFVLDAAGGRIFRLAPRTTTLRMACRLRLDHPVSLALAGDRAAIAYVAHAAGLARVDLATGRSTRVAASKSLRLDGLERIRFDSGHIVGTQRGEDGIRHVVSIRIAGGSAPRALGVERLDSVDAVAGGTLTALSGNDVYFLTREAGHDGEDGEFVVHRARVR